MLLSQWSQRNQPSVTDEPADERLFTMPLGGGEMREGKPHVLNQEDRNELRRELGLLDAVHELDAQFDKFCKTLELAIGFFKAHRDIPNPKSERGKNRLALKELSKTAIKLERQLDQLPAGALRELDLALQALSHRDGEFVDPDRTVSSEGKPTFSASMMHPASSGTSALLEALRTLLTRIASAVEFAQEHRRADPGGRSVNAAQIVLAQAVARMFRLLDEKPTTTIEGRYERVLRIALRAGGRGDAEVRDLHGLVLKGLKSIEPA